MMSEGPGTTELGEVMTGVGGSDRLRGLSALVVGALLIGLAGWWAAARKARAAAKNGSPNGSGKSTILRALARLMPPQAGAVYLDAGPLFDGLSENVEVHAIVDRFLEHTLFIADDDIRRT